MIDIVPSIDSACKHCPVCDRELPATPEYFSRATNRPDGWQYECKECHKRRAERTRQKKNPPKQHPLFIFSKVCLGCGQDKDIDEFSLHKGFLDGHTSQCKDCMNAQGRADYYANHERELARQRAKDKSKTRASNRKHYAHNRKRITARRREHYATDQDFREKKLTHQSLHYQEHRKEKLEKGRAYYAAHPEQKKNHNLRRYAAKKGATLEKVDYKRILERDGWHCYICEQAIDPNVRRGPARLTFDHRIPLQPRPGEPQGTHSEDNLHPTHLACNVRKGNRPFESLKKRHRRGP